MDPNPAYTKMAVLEGSEGPINALAFSPDGRHLASGGDDECVRIWSVTRRECEEILKPRYDSKFEILGWGQITTIVWINVGDNNEEPVKTHLLFGTARGLLVVAEINKTKGCTSQRPISIFSRKDVVESIAIDPAKRYLVLGNQVGLLKVYKLLRRQAGDHLLDLRLHWVSNESEEIPSIPRNLAFFNKYIFTFWLEAGQITYCELGDGNDDMETEQGKIAFSGGIIGNACLSDPPESLLIHNLATGHFDIYDFPLLKKRRTLKGATRIPIVKQAVFAESNRVAVCGSDDGSVYIYDVQSGILLQRLQHAHWTLDRGQSRTLYDYFRRDREHKGVSIQTVTHFASKERYLIASGSSTARGSIVVWEKPTSVLPRAWGRRDRNGAARETIEWIFVLMLIASTLWLLYYRQLFLDPIWW